MQNSFRKNIAFLHQPQRGRATPQVCSSCFQRQILFFKADAERKGSTETRSIFLIFIVLLKKNILRFIYYAHIYITLIYTHTSYIILKCIEHRYTLICRNFQCIQHIYNTYSNAFQMMKAITTPTRDFFKLRNIPQLENFIIF